MDTEPSQDAAGDTAYKDRSSGLMLRIRKLKPKDVFTWQLAKTLAMGQGLAGLICGTAVTSQYLATSFHVNTPMMQSFLNYSLLCVTYTSLLLCRTDSEAAMVEVPSAGPGGRGGQLHCGESIPVHHPHQCAAVGLLCHPSPDDSVLVDSEDPLQADPLRSRLYLSAGGGGHGGGRPAGRTGSGLLLKHPAGRLLGADQRDAVRSVQRVPGVHREEPEQGGVPGHDRPVRHHHQHRTDGGPGA